MTAMSDLDQLLSSVLEADGPQTVPVGLVDDALSRASTLPQRRPLIPALDRRSWPARGPRPIVTRSPRIVTVVVLAVTVLALVAVALLAGSSRPPTVHALPGFVRPFEYAMPVDADLRLGSSSRAMVTFAVGPIHSPRPEESIGGGHPKPTESRGIFIGSAMDAWSHSPGGRYGVATQPMEFLVSLRDTGKVTMSPIADTTLDGRPALTADLPGWGGIDIHVTQEGLPYREYMSLQLPSRLIVADVDGVTVFIFAWARNPDDLAEWMPMAEQFVDSIHFVERSQP